MSDDLLLPSGSPDDDDDDDDDLPMRMKLGARFSTSADGSPAHSAHWSAQRSLSSDLLQ